MTTISSVNRAWASTPPPRIEQRADTTALSLITPADGSGGANATAEWEDIPDAHSQARAAGMISRYDGNGDGGLDVIELAQALNPAAPQRSTVDFVQSRSEPALAEDGRFLLVDEDNSATVSQPELQALLDVAANNDATGNTQATSEDAAALFSVLDTDQNGQLSPTEFNTALPDASAADAAPVAGGMAEPPFDPLDTNANGVVSEAKIATASTDSTDPLTALFDTIDTDGDSTISSGEANAFIDELGRQYDNATTAAQSASDEAAAANGERVDLARVAELALGQYESVADAWARRTSAGSLSAMA